ncbi:ABC transporter substrate-binding protein [Pseudalkalibacillus salsuginis]|uniref:ABC transporter substrate-binding protein n=1 Tax=Pseudalkalibacillus salsuginis TaxID=2910972 RepID=UPI001F16AD80|nr:ABC transporter substrate-binding protein [Pseudalkalibacillus salsuginis]MCF6408978.1 ABC transporter substrate-binding protein [Pseudalkalibacillus salsuginis]
MNIKKVLTGLSAGFLLLTVAACGNSKQGNGDGSSDKLTIGYVNVMDDAPAMLAEDAGLYEKHGLDVELKLFGSGTDLIKGIVNGELDAGVLGATNAVSWAAKGADLKIVGGAQMGYHSILARKASGIKSVEDLKGKSLASQKQGSTADIVLNGVTLQEAGLKRSDLNMNYVSPTVAVQSLQSGKVDAAFLFEPYDRIARLQGDVEEIYEIGEVWPFPCMVVITSGEIMKEDQDSIYKVLDAQKEAIEMLENDPGKSAEHIYKRFSEGETFQSADGEVPAVDVIEEAIEAQTFNWELTPENVKQIQEVSDLMVEQDIMDSKFNVEEIMDLSWQKKNK